MASALAPSGFGSFWLRRENSASGSAFKPGVDDCASADATRARDSNGKKTLNGDCTAPITARRVRETGSNPRPSPAAIAGVLHGPPFRLDLRQAGAAFHFHDLIAQ